MLKIYVGDLLKDDMSIATTLRQQLEPNLLPWLSWYVVLNNHIPFRVAVVAPCIGSIPFYLSLSGNILEGESEIYAKMHSLWNKHSLQITFKLRWIRSSLGKKSRFRLSTTGQHSPSTLISVIYIHGWIICSVIPVLLQHVNPPGIDTGQRRVPFSSH